MKSDALMQERLQSSAIRVHVLMLRIGVHKKTVYVVEFARPWGCRILQNLDRDTPSKKLSAVACPSDYGAIERLHRLSYGRSRGEQCPFVHDLVLKVTWDGICIASIRWSVSDATIHSFRCRRGVLR